MSGNIKGICIEFRGDTTKLDKALRDIENNTKKLDRELKQVDKALKFNPKSVELWSQKQQILTEKIQETEKRLDALKQAKAKADADPNIDKESAEYRQLSRDIEITENQLKNFNRELKKIGNVKLRALSEQFKDIGKKLTNAGKTLTTKMSVPLAAVGAASLKVGMDFDTAMSQVAATMGTTVDKIGDLRDFAKEMGSTTAFSATQAAEGLNYMALAGYDAEKSMKMLPTVLNLAAAGNMELAAASDMVTDAQSALGLTTEETVDLVNQMAKASSTTNTSVAQLGEALLTVGGTAKMMKGGTQELSQVLGLLADNGIKGAEGGTALRNILLSLSSPTSKASKEMEALGLKVFDAEGNMRPMKDIIGDLNGALSSLTDEQRTQAIASIFNKRDLKSVNALLGTSAERWDEVGNAIENAGDAASEMAETQLDNLGGSLTMLKSALEGAGISIGDVLAPAIRKIADFITGLIQKFNDLSPTAQKIIVIIGTIAAAIGPVLLVLGTLASSIGSIISLVATIGPAIGGIVAAFGPVILIIGAVVAAGILLYKNWDTVKAKAIQLKDRVVSAFNTLKGKVTSIINSIKSSVTSTFNAIKNAITHPIETAVNLVRSAIEKMKSIINNAHLSLPKFKLPHFRISGGTLPWGIGGKGTPPKINVDWYAQGGIFDRASIIGVGEAGPEAVVPLDKLWSKLDKLEGGNTYNFYITGDNPKAIAEEVKRILIKETNNRRLAWQ